VLGLILLVASIGLADSINPSTLIPGLWLGGVRPPRVLAGFTLGVFFVYLVGGLVLVFGPGPVLIHWLHHLHGIVGHVLEAALGVIVLAVAVTLRPSRPSDPAPPHRHRSFNPVSAFALGGGIMLIELPTAFVYFGAIGAILTARLAAPVEVALLVVYNLLFVAPLLVLLGAGVLARERADRWIAAVEARMHHIGRVVLSGVAGVGGAALLTLGVAGLVVS
jgi:Sap, sulfolipid-1-addressing protein